MPVLILCGLGLIYSIYWEIGAVIEDRRLNRLDNGWYWALVRLEIR